MTRTPATPTKNDPVCTDVEIQVSTGGAVQVVKFNLRNDFGLTYGEHYSIPSNWTPERVEEWTTTKITELKEKVDAFAQVEQDALLASSDWYRD